MKRTIIKLITVFVLLLLGHQKNYADTDPSKTYIRVNWISQMGQIGSLFSTPTSSPDNPTGTTYEYPPTGELPTANTSSVGIGYEIPGSCIISDGILTPSVTMKLRALFAYDNLSDYPAIFLHYNFGGIEIDHFGPIQGGNNLYFDEELSLYVAEFFVEVDLSSFCPDGEYTNFNAEVSLKDSNGNIYPTENFDGLDEIYSAEHFYENALDSQTAPFYEEIKTICCTQEPENIEPEIGVGKGYFTNSDNFRYGNKVKRTKIIGEKKVDKGIKVYPNPFSNKINIINNINTNNSIIISDISGRIKWKGKLERDIILELDTKFFEKGIYIVKVFSENEWTHFKIIKK